MSIKTPAEISQAALAAGTGQRRVWDRGVVAVGAPGGGQS